MLLLLLKQLAMQLVEQLLQHARIVVVMHSAGDNLQPLDYCSLVPILQFMM